MTRIEQFRDKLAQDMTTGARALDSDFYVRMTSILVACALVSLYLPPLPVISVAGICTLFEIFIKTCHRIQKHKFTLRLYGLWGGLNLSSNIIFASLSIMLVDHPEPSAQLLGLMILIGCLSQPVIVGVSSIVLSYGCLFVTLVIGFHITLHIVDYDKTPWAVIFGFLVLSMHTFFVTYSSRSVMQARNKAQAEADAAAAAKTRFMTAISHEIRTPLNGIMGIAQLAKERAQTPEEYAQANLLVQTSDNLKQLLDDVLDQAKIEAGQMKMSYAPDDMREIIHQTMALFRANASSKGVELHCAFHPKDGDFCVCIDQLRLTQILSNLLSNAIKFTDQGSVFIETTLTKSPGANHQLRVSVRDSGCGMSPQEMRELFQDFSQVDHRQERAAKGTGLGLSISRGLANKMNGDITVGSIPGKGSEFVLSIPTQCIQPAPSHPELTPDAPVDLTGWRILIVDDNATNRFITFNFLKNTGASLSTADSGAKALEALKATPQDLMLLDINMPEMDGPTMFDHMQTTVLPGLAPKVVALTAHTQNGVAKTYLRMGMDGYLPKPLTKLALLQELARLGIRAPKPNPKKM